MSAASEANGARTASPAPSPKPTMKRARSESRSPSPPAKRARSASRSPPKDAPSAKPAANDARSSSRSPSPPSRRHEPLSASGLQPITEQIEFYFSDAKLPLDKFMMKLTHGSANRAVPLKKIDSFSRMRDFDCAYSDVIEAVKASSKLELVLGERHERGDEMVKRKIPLDERYAIKDDSRLAEELHRIAKLRQSDTEKRTAIVTGFMGEYQDKKGSLQQDLEHWFYSLSPSVESVSMRRDRNKAFRGEVRVEFATEDDCAKLLEDFEGGKRCQYAKKDVEAARSDLWHAKMKAKKDAAKKEKVGGEPKKRQRRERSPRGREEVKKEAEGEGGEEKTTDD